MSRIGDNPVFVPDGVEVDIKENVVRVKGPKGELEKEVPREINIEQQDNQLQVKRPTNSKKHRSLHGLTRALVANMVIGVTEGFTKTLDIVGVGYRATQQGDKVNLAIGFSHPVVIEPEENISIEVPSNNRIVVRGIDKEKVGDFPRLFLMCAS